MMSDRQNECGSYAIDEVPSNFSDAPDGIKVSTHAFHTVLEPYENSWVTMVTLRTPRNSAVKETSLPTLTRFL